MGRIRGCNQAIEKIRELAQGLLAVVSEGHGLMSALERWADEVQDVCHVNCGFQCEEPVLIDDVSVATHLCPIAQEAVNNAIKHGKPGVITKGEELRMVLLSVTEGEDKPLKYPTIFNSADVAVITKTDLEAATEFDAELAHRNINAVRPGMRIFSVSSKTGEGFDEFLAFLSARRADVRPASLERI